MTALRRLALGALLASSLSACGQDPARVTLVPLDLGNCGRPLGANQLSITAYGETGEVTRAVGIDRAIDIGDFPDDTLQLGVEVLIGGGDAGAAGKTPPLAFADLPDGTAISIVMLPPGGFCPVGSMIDARKSPQIARAGTGVLVLGGIGEGGPLSTAEFYDSATGTFSAVEVPEALQDATNGLAGTVLSTLPDGRVVLTGGPRGLLAIFDPATRSFGATFAISPQRAFHGAVATVAPGGGARVLLAGGCQGVDLGTCNSTPLRSSVEYSLDGTPLTTGPSLDATAIAEGARLFDTGAGFVLAGGFGTAGEAHRFTLSDVQALRLTGLGGQPVMLDGGTVLTAFGGDGAAALGGAAAITPSGAVVSTTSGPALAGVELVALEDGRVIGFGGDTGVDAFGAARVVDYNPHLDLWALRGPTGSVDHQPPRLDAPAAIRLDDGSILVLGGEQPATANAWLYRPSLVGPASGSITAIPTNPQSPATLTPADPATLDRTTSWVLTSPDDALTARALVGGPRMTRGLVKVAVNVQAGGFALIAQQTAPGRALVARLVPDQPLRVEELGGEGVVCTGPIVALPPNPVIATLEIGDGIAVRIDDTVALSCDHRATGFGAWGIAADGIGAQIDVATVTVAR